jgi:hypothetical protein
LRDLTILFKKKERTPGAYSTKPKQGCVSLESAFANDLAFETLAIGVRAGVASTH